MKISVKKKLNILLLLLLLCIVFSCATECGAARAKGKWVKDSIGWRYETASGKWVKNRWMKVNQKWYRFNKKGYLLKKGWRKINGRWYYIETGGCRSAGEWRDGYYLSKKGIRIKSEKWELKKQKKGIVFRNTSGKMIKNKWIQVDGTWYFFNPKGYLEKEGYWKGYLAKANGSGAHKVLYSWRKGKKGWRYKGADGSCLKRTWAKIDGKEYYFRSDGIMSTEIKDTDDDLVSYYRDPVYNVIGELDEQGDDYTSFIILTDTHGLSNQQHSQAIVRFLLDHSKADKCFWMGEYSSGSFDVRQFKGFAKGLLPNSKNIYTTIGNHDRSPYTDYQPNQLAVAYQLFLKDKEENSVICGNPEDFYYYFDEQDSKIRYLVLNTCNDRTNEFDMTDDEIKWLKKTAVKLPGADWKLVVFGHLPIEAEASYEHTSVRSDEIIAALSGCNGTVVGYYCGHRHKDLYGLVEEKFYQVVFNCDKNRNTSRLSGTVNEQAVSIVSLNTKTGDVKLRRIGFSGKNRLKSYNYRTLEKNTEP